MNNGHPFGRIVLYLVGPCNPLAVIEYFCIRVESDRGFAIVHHFQGH